MLQNIGKIIRVNDLPTREERLTNVIYQVSVPGTATYIDYAVDENGDIKTPTLDTNQHNNDLGKVKSVNSTLPDEKGNIDIKHTIAAIYENGGLYSEETGALNSSSVNKELLKGSILIGDNTAANLTNSQDVATIPNIISIGKGSLENSDLQNLNGVIAIGENAYKNGFKGNGNVALGYKAAENINPEKLATTGFSNFIGLNAGGELKLAYGSNHIGCRSGYKVGTSNYSSTIGYQAGMNAEHLSNDVLIGSNAGSFLTKGAGSGASIGIGQCSYGGWNINNNIPKTQYSSIFIGNYAGSVSSREGNYNIGIGHHAGRDVKGNANIAIGGFHTDNFGAGRDLSGDHNIILGARSGYGTGNHNFIVGYFMGSTLNGSSNVNILGARNLVASNTVLINSGFDSSFSPTNNDVVIAHKLLIGNSATKKLGIGLKLPSDARERLDIGNDGYIAGKGFKFGNTTFLTSLHSNSLTENRTQTLQDKNGTIALLEDLTPSKLIDILSSATPEEMTTLKGLLAS